MSSETEISLFWMHVFQAMIFDGTLARLEGGAVKVYMVIKAHASLKDGVCGPGLDRVSKLSGQSQRQVLRHISALVDAGLLMRERKGRSNRYRVIEKFHLNNIHMDWTYTPRRVTGLRTALKQVAIGEMHPEIRIRLNATKITSTTTTTTTLELVQTHIDLNSIQAECDQRMAVKLNPHLERFRSKNTDTDDT